MVVPLMILALLSLVGGWVGVPQSLHGSDHFDTSCRRFPVRLSLSPELKPPLLLRPHGKEEASARN